MPDHGLTKILPFFAPAEKTARADSNPTARLVELAAGGNADAFAELYSFYSAMVHGIAVARVGIDQADDIVQDVFLTAFAKIEGLRDVDSFGGWLAAIARNRAALFHRREEPLEELPESLHARPEYTVEAREVLRKVRELPEAYRETIVLRFIEGMTGPEIARLTGMTADSVRVNLNRGLKILRSKLGVK